MKLANTAILSSLALAGMCLSSSGSWAQSAPAGSGATAPEQVAAGTIKVVNKPQLKSYRTMLAGLDAFEQHRHLAPGVTQLRFLLSPNQDADNSPASMAGLTLRIVGTATSVAVPLAFDGGFTLPRYQQAIDEDADLILNRRARLFGWSPDVRTPGLPTDTRRLGDLRLECEIGAAIARKGMGFMELASQSLQLMGKTLCTYGQYSAYAFSTGLPIQNATLIAGSRRMTLPFRGVDYQAPLPDLSWPDDALIQFQFVEPVRRLAPVAPPVPVVPPEGAAPTDAVTPAPSEPPAAMPAPVQTPVPVPVQKQ